jgi:hypothetical protein
LDKLSETLRKSFDEKVELRRDLGAEEPTDGTERSKQCKDDWPNRPSFRYPRPAAHHACETPQQEGQKGRPESQDQDTGKSPSGKHARNREDYQQ